MALDFGEKTIGVALSDPTRMLAQPLLTIQRKNIKADLAQVALLVKTHQVSDLVIGLPLNMDGSESPMAEKATAFAKRLRGAIKAAIHTWDERLTTAAAERSLLEGDVRRERRREVVDQIAASFILEGWLRQNASKSEML